MSGEPSWNKADLDFDERGRLIIRNRALANRILDAHNSNQGLRIVHEQQRVWGDLGPDPFPPRPVPMPGPIPRPDAMCECEFLLDKLNGLRFPPSPNV